MCFLPSHLEQEHVTKMNRNSANTCLTDMPNVSIESFKLLLNEINQIESKNSFIIIIICKDALLSKSVSNEMASQDRHLQPGPRGVKKSGPIGPGLKCRALSNVDMWGVFK